MNSTIASAQMSPVQIVGSRLVPAAPAALPSRQLGLGPFALAPATSGLPRLVDAGGQVLGVFVNEQLARQTAAALAS